MAGNSISDPGMLRIALYTYSTQPRGGVVHTLALAENLQALGHDVHIYALGRHGQTGFFRPTSVPFTLIPCEDRGPDEAMDDRIQRYIQSYLQFLAARLPGAFDIHHSQDCISANALFFLREDGVIPWYVRTIHHIDDFTSPALIDCQNRSVYRPELPIVVSRHWQQRISQDYGVEAVVIHNGVDVTRFRPPTVLEREAARAELGMDSQFVFLSIGGVDPRKNSINLLRAFYRVKHEMAAQGREAALVLAGGATLLDYQAYRDSFQRELAESGLRAGKDISILGVVPEARIPRLYWAADALAFPSVKEGWGLVALEALASGVPVLSSDIPVFREYLAHEENAILVNPQEEQSIAAGMSRLCMDGQLRRRLAIAGAATARRFSWEATARAHIDCYRAAIARALAARP